MGQLNNLGKEMSLLPNLSKLNRLYTQGPFGTDGAWTTLIEVNGQGQLFGFMIWGYNNPTLLANKGFRCTIDNLIIFESVNGAVSGSGTSKYPFGGRCDQFESLSAFLNNYGSTEYMNPSVFAEFPFVETGLTSMGTIAFASRPIQFLNLKIEFYGLAASPLYLESIYEIF